MGVLGYNTGHKAPEGQGATDNVFNGNVITLEGPYFTTGLIVGAESEGTILKDNVINLKSEGVSYGITLELSRMSVIENNIVSLNSEVIYGIEALSSDRNVITGNKFSTAAKQVYGILLSTILSTLVVGFPWLFYNLFKWVFKTNAKKYVLTLLLQTTSTILTQHTFITTAKAKL